MENSAASFPDIYPSSHDGSFSTACSLACSLGRGSDSTMMNLAVVHTAAAAGGGGSGEAWSVFWRFRGERLRGLASSGFSRLRLLLLPTGLTALAPSTAKAAVLGATVGPSTAATTDNSVNDDDNAVINRLTSGCAPASYTGRGSGRWRFLVQSGSLRSRSYRKPQLLQSDWVV